VDQPSKTTVHRFSLFKDPFPKDPLIKYADFQLLSYSEETDHEYQRQLKVIFVVEGLLYFTYLNFIIPVIPIPYFQLFLIVFGLLIIDIILRFQLPKGFPEKKSSFLTQFLKHKDALSNYYNDILSIPDRGKLALHPVGLSLSRAYRDRWDGLRLVLLSILLMFILFPFSTYAMDEITETPYRLNIIVFTTISILAYLVFYPLLIAFKTHMFQFIASRDLLYRLVDKNYSSAHQFFILIIASIFTIVLIPLSMIILSCAASFAGIILSACILFIFNKYTISLYKKRYSRIMRIFLQNQRDFVKILDFVALRDVAKDPDWFRHDEKRIVQLCQRYSVDPHIFSNTFPVADFIESKRFGKEEKSP
jgi:hypothetical protein